MRRHGVGAKGNRHAVFGVNVRARLGPASVGAACVTLFALAALVPGIGDANVGGSTDAARVTDSVVAFTRLLTGISLLLLSTGPHAASLAAAAAPFALTGVLTLAASAITVVLPDPTLATVVSAERTALELRALLPVSLAAAVTLPHWTGARWRWPRLSGRAGPFLAMALLTAALAIPVAIADRAFGGTSLVPLNPGPLNVALPLLACAVVVLRRRAAGPLAPWVFVASLAAAFEATVGIAAQDLTLGWYISLALSLVAAGVVLVGATLGAGRAVREGQVAQARSEFEARALRLALQDELTGLPNARAMERAVAEARSAGRRARVVLLALDGLDDVRDAFGKSRSDGLVRAAAARLGERYAAAGTLARVGDEELALLVADPAARPLDLAREMVRALDEPFAVDGVTLSVSASGGVAEAPRDAGEPAMLLDRAAMAARAARARRRAALEYGDHLELRRPDEILLLSELGPAIARGELTLFYQPKVRLRDRAVMGVEGLVRWRHPSRGLVMPADFIPLAERSHVITDLTRWAIHVAAERVRAWRAEGLDLAVAVNLPARSLADRRLLAVVEAALEQRAIPASKLRLEITETDAMAEINLSLLALHALRERGLGLSVDDFGTGYSSLAYLARLPIDEVKIDRSFVRDMRTDGASRAIVRSAIDLAHRLGYVVTAEGVEDEATWDELALAGCDCVQGYYVSRPLPADELIPVLRAGRWGV